MISAMIVAALGAALESRTTIMQDQPPIVPEVRPGKDGRGRDPWVFRLIFEDHTRAVAVALRKDFWYVFNPETGSPLKVWSGTMDFRGKVWDFSQDNSLAKGDVLAAAETEIMRLQDSVLDDWETKGVVWSDGWKFTGDGARLTSPVFDLSAWHRVFVAFDEQSRRGRMLVEVSNDGGATWGAEHFSSATSVTNDTEWQWNFKQIATVSHLARIRFVQTQGAHQKALRNVRVYGDQAAWLDQNGEPLRVVWRGYETRGETQSVSLLYDLVLPDGRVVNVRHRPEAIDGFKEPSWSELISVRGLKPGDYVFYSALPPRARLRSIFLPDGSRRTDGSRWPFGLGADGDVLIKYEGL